jgi:hypothetical protein
MGEMRTAHEILLRKPDRIRLLGRPSHRGKYLKEIWWEVVEWLYLA